MKTIYSYIYNKVKSMVVKAMFSTLFTLVGISTLTSCEAEDRISRRFLCRFDFHTQNHPGNTLEIALNGFGTYTFVSTSYKNNIWHIYSTPNDGRNKTEDIRITAVTEQQYAKAYNLGANNGIIIGNSNFNKYRAYDRQCPNCIDQYGGTNFPLNWNSSNRQQVICDKCHRIYDLEYGNIIDGADGSRLMEYNLSYKPLKNETGKVISVYN